MSSTLENKVKSLKEGREQLQNEVDILGDYSRRLGDAVVEMKTDFIFEPVGEEASTVRVTLRASLRFSAKNFCVNLFITW